MGTRSVHASDFCGDGIASIRMSDPSSVPSSLFGGQGASPTTSNVESSASDSTRAGRPWQAVSGSSSEDSPSD